MEKFVFLTKVPASRVVIQTSANRTVGGEWASHESDVLLISQAYQHLINQAPFQHHGYVSPLSQLSTDLLQVAVE